MTRTIARPDLARPSWGRLLLVAAMLLAFALQGYATQTHIHKLDGRAGLVTLSLDKTGHTKYPPGDDPVNCALCQQISHAGQYVVPAWLAPFLILDAVSVIEIAPFVMPRFDAVSHGWRSRGPPLR
jgi:hypothetical protein